MADVDPVAFQERFRALEAELGAFDLGTAITLPLGLGEQWLNVIVSEIRRCLALYESHYRRFEGPRTIRIGGGSISDSRDELIATIGFLQGVTFAEALRQERSDTV